MDLDFPVVFRAEAGFDSIAQAAGRCNREGRLPLGQTYIFEAEQPPPPGLLRAAAQAARELIDSYGDPLKPEAIEAYFRHFYWSQSHNWDKRHIMRELSPDLADEFLSIQFREAARKYKVIEDDQYPILIPYDATARKLWTALHRGAEYVSQRQLQPYMVSVRKHEMQRLEQQGLVIEHGSGVWLLLNEAAYSRSKGLLLATAQTGPAYLEI